MSALKINFIDINALGFAAMYVGAFARMEHEGKPTGGIHGTLQSVLSLCKAHSDYIPVVLWDGQSQFRKALLPEYKSSRTATPEKLAIRASYKLQCPAIRQLLAALGIPQISSRDCEADDIAGWLCSLLDDEDDIILSTKDTDWYQALRANIRMFVTSKRLFVTAADLATRDMGDGTFDSAAQYVMAKSMAGDTSDDIPGVPGVGLKTAVKLLREHGSFEALWAKHDAGEPIKGAVAGKVAGPEYRDMYRRNLELVDWCRAPAIPPHTALLAPAKDDAQFAALCENWGLDKLAQMGKSFALNPLRRAHAVARISHLLDASHAPDRRMLAAA